jgi:D-glycerate 3-kinase
VDRYIPGYIFFSDGITCGPSVTTTITTHTKNTPRWIGKSFRITIGEGREFVGEEVF